MLEKIKNDPDIHYQVMTGYERWVFQYDPEMKRQSMQWKTAESPRPKKARMSKSKIKVMLIAFFDQKSLVHHDFVAEDETVNQYYYPGASPAGGQGGQCPPDFRFCPSDLFLAPPRYFFKLVFLGGKTLKFAILARKSLRISAKTFFFGDYLLFGGKVAISARKSLRISAKTFAFLILILPPDLAKLATPQLLPAGSHSPP